MKPKITLSEQQHADFEEQGYLVFPGFLDEEEIKRYKQSVDEKVSAGQGHGKYAIEFGDLGQLTAHEGTMGILDQLFGEQNYTMHHIHAVRHDAGCGGVHWHHDYEQFPQTNRHYLMVHVFYYLNGLNGEVGDLLVKPGSHKVICERDLSCFGTEDLPGSLTFDDLESGSMVVVHSALFHGRRQKDGGEDRPRFFIDVSYCEKGIKWPRYHNADIINQIAFKNNLDQDGKYAYLYDTNQFFERGAIREKLNEVDESIRHIFSPEKYSS